MYVVNKHLVILLETRESQEHREEHPRARRRYFVSCTCSGRRDANEHCIHTRAFMEDNVKPETWRYITAKPMSAPNDPGTSPNRKRATATASKRSRPKSKSGAARQETP